MITPGSAGPGGRPVVRLDGGSGREGGDGWTTPRHEARRLQRALGGELVAGGAFGGPWPVVRLGDASVAAPGVPLRVTPDPVDGPDGRYELADDAVWRTVARGRERVVAVATPDEPPGEAADLLWFEDTSRWLVRAGTIEVEDPFSRLTVPVDTADLDRLLVRGHRVDAAVLDGVVTRAGGVGVACLEVWREAELVAPEVADDPARLIVRRPEVARLERHGNRLRGVDADGAPVELDVELDPSGWTLVRLNGRLPFDRMRLDRVAQRVRVSVELVSTVDSLAPGVRQRLAFDLFSDLVAAARGPGQNR